MEDTCHHADCKLHELLGGKPEECPNYLETWWNPLEGKPKLVKDCAPIRTMLMVQELYNQQIRLQAAQEEQRNRTTKVLEIIENAAAGRMVGGLKNSAMLEIDG